ncbi:MAG: hypothetical protein RLZZ427_1474 [Pseudomonadota bacterium]|jgi:hypothetical protein
MATLIFSAIGTLVGGPLGGAIGALAGRQVDGLVLGNGSREGPRLTELAVTTSSYGIAVPRLFGRMRVAGQIIWATDLVEHRDKRSNGKGKPATVEYSYSASFAVALSSRRITSIGRIWADGNLLRGAAGDLKTGGAFRFYPGSGDQPVDPLLASAEAAGRCPAYRNLAYGVFEDLQLASFGNRIPALTFEIVADTAPLSLDLLLDGVIANHDAAVPLTGLAGLSVDGPVTTALAALTPLYPADCDACAGQLTIGADRHQSAPIALAEAARSADPHSFGANAGFARTRKEQGEAPVAVLRYYDVDRDYQPGVQRLARRPQPGQPGTLELPAALEAGTARQLIENAARRDQWGRQTLVWRVAQIDPAVRPGAIVTVPEQPGEWQVREWEWREYGVDLNLVRQAPQFPSGLPVDSGRITPPTDLPTGTTALAVCELPWDGNPGTTVPLVLAAASSSGSGWAGASLYVDQGDGILSMLGTTGRSRATIGTAVSILPPATPLLFDRRSSVVIELVAADALLNNATMRQLAMGANRALLGSEIIQFATATPLGQGRWALTGLWRGRGGTESAVASHAAGDRFILLDGTGSLLDPEAIGTIPDTQIAALGLGDATPITAPIALRGIGLRPPPPVHGRAAKLSDGSLQLRWIRRARGAWEWPDGVNTPLNEQSERYAVAFGPAAAPLARWDVLEPQLEVPAAQLSALFASLPDGVFTVRQIGDRAASDGLIIRLP